MYRIDTRLAIADFLIDDDARRELGVTRTPREQLLLSEGEDDFAMGLFMDDAVIDNLHRNDPGEELHEGNFGDFLLAVEGVSHFVYMAYCAHRERPVSGLELELQAEVDKYVTCLLTLGSSPERSDRLRRRLYEQFSFEDDLDEHERDRYRTANAGAHRYSASLERRFVSSRRIADMLRELRNFYRMPLGRKLAFIGHGA